MQIRYLQLVCRSNDVDYPMYLDAPVETTEESSTFITKAILCCFMGDINSEIHLFVPRKVNTPENCRRLLSEFGGKGAFMGKANFQRRFQA